MDKNPYILKNSYQCPPPDTWKGCGFIFLFKREEGQGRYRGRRRTRVSRYES